MLDKRISQSKKFGKISDKARTIYFMIYPHLDREGRIAFDDLEDLKEEIIPRFKNWTLKKLALSLNELADIGLIHLYPNSEKIAIEFYKFSEFQIGLRRDREAESKISPLQKGDELLRINLDSYKLNINKVKLNEYNEQSAELRKAPQFIFFDFIEKAWKGIANEDLKFFKETFPAVDIEAELKKMAAWLLANPEKKKKNYRRFITNWLSRTQERGGTAQPKMAFKSFDQQRKEEIQKDYQRLEERLKEKRCRKLNFTKS